MEIVTGILGRIVDIGGLFRRVGVVSGFFILD